MFLEYDDDEAPYEGGLCTRNASGTHLKLLAKDPSHDDVGNRLAQHLPTERTE